MKHTYTCCSECVRSLTNRMWQIMKSTITMCIITSVLCYIQHTGSQLNTQDMCSLKSIDHVGQKSRKKNSSAGTLKNRFAQVVVFFPLIWLVLTGSDWFWLVLTGSDSFELRPDINDKRSYWVFLVLMIAQSSSQFFHTPITHTFTQCIYCMCSTSSITHHPHTAVRGNLGFSFLPKGTSGRLGVVESGRLALPPQPQLPQNATSPILYSLKYRLHMILEI